MLGRIDRHLKWPPLDVVEWCLIVAAGTLLAVFTLTVFLDVLTRIMAAPLLWLQEATRAAFTYGVFLGAAAALRRGEHFKLSALGEGLRGKPRAAVELFNGAVLLAISGLMMYFGWFMFLRGFASRLPVTGVPISYLSIALPISGLLGAVFVLERITMGLRHGFDPPPGQPDEFDLLAGELDPASAP